MKTYLGAALMVIATVATAAASYSLNLHVSGERAAVRKLQMDIVAETRAIRALEAELRTRARMPELERWNALEFRMSAPGATQYLRSPVQLAGFVAPPSAPPAPPAVQYAIAPAPAPAAVPVIRAAYEPAPALPTAAPARVVKASFGADGLATSIAASLDTLPTGEAR